MKLKLQTLVLVVLLSGVSACKDKKAVQAEAEVAPGILSDSSGYNTRQANKDGTHNPNTIVVPNTDPKGIDPLPLGPSPKPKSIPQNNTNPLFENPILTQTFQAYIDSGIDDPLMEGKLDKLKDEDLSAEDLKEIMDQFHRVLFNGNKEFAEKLPIQERMKLIFNLFASNEKLGTYIQTNLIPAHLLEPFSNQEKKLLSPFVFAATTYGILTKTESPLPTVYSSIDARDGKRYRTVALGRIDFSKGVKKKSLDPEDIKTINAIATVWKGYIQSSLRIDGRMNESVSQVVGFADQDKPSNTEKNMAYGLARAEMVYNAYEKLDPSKTYIPTSMGDAYPYLENPKDPKNRRVEFILFHREVKVLPMGKLPPPHEHEEGEEDHAPDA